jgi:signal transduction histidine kinase
LRNKKQLNLFKLFANSKIKDYRIQSDQDIIESSQLMGIGLAYCQKMLKLMSSELKLTSLVDIGSTFSFKIKTDYLCENKNCKTISDPSEK